MARDRLANRLYMREYRSRGSDLGVTTIGAGPVTQPGAVVAGVLAEIDLLADQGAARPGVVAAVVVVAAVLDNPTAVPQHPAAAGRLADLLAELRQSEPPRPRGALARLQAGVRRPGPDEPA